MLPNMIPTCSTPPSDDFIADLLAATSIKPTINSLPEALLARVLDLAPPCLDLLLVCKLWWRVALAHGLSHWHTVGLRRVCAGANWPVKGLPAAAASALVRGFDRTAPHFRRLCIDACNQYSVWHLQQLVPQLLTAAGRRGAHLRHLELDTGDMNPELLHATLKMKSHTGVGTFTQLQELLLTVYHNEDVALHPLRLELLAPLRALRQLCSLELRLLGQQGHLPPGLLCGLPHLTRLAVVLGFEVGQTTFHQIAWGGGAGGPALRALRLSSCCAAASDLTPGSLRALESLEVVSGGVSPHLFEVLPQLPRLTRLELRRPAASPLAAWDVPAQAAALEALWKCAHLQELALARLAGPGLPDSWAGAALPAGALSQLTLLEMDTAAYAWPHGPAWGQPVMLPPGFSQMQALQDLDLESCDCGDVPPALAALRHLTRLCMCEVNFSRQEAPPGPYLGRLRQLVVTAGSNWTPATPWRLPAALGAAACLEQLDLTKAAWLVLHGAEDAALLSQLPAL